MIRSHDTHPTQLDDAYEISFLYILCDSEIHPTSWFVVKRVKLGDDLPESGTACYTLLFAFACKKPIKYTRTFSGAISVRLY